MKRDSEKIFLYKVEKDELVNAELYEGLSEQNITDHEKKWIPTLTKANEESKAKGEGLVAEDAHWNWKNKALKTMNQLSFTHYVIECNGETVGFLLLKLDGSVSRLEEGKSLVYIDYICVSPENRPVINNQPVYQGIGSVLFHIAIEVSIYLGMNGRVGLHSLPKAREWYKDKLGLNALGADESYYNLEYFELSSEQATSLRDKYNN